MKINTGKGTIPLLAMLAIWSVSAVTSLPGLAISPILGELSKIFPSATHLEIQMLSSLPSLLIIPCVLVAGKLSEGKEPLSILVLGLAIFFVSGLACIVVPKIGWLILISCVLGIGAGLVIPFSTGLIVRYFTGDYRVRQLGYSSAINNLTLVVATIAAGSLAGVDWHLAFLVYTLSGVALILVFTLYRVPAVDEPKESLQLRNEQIDWRKLFGLMLFYLFITYAVLVITYDISFLAERYHLSDADSGWLISLFFLAIMLPGLFIAPIIRTLRSNVNLLSLLLVAIGLICIGFFRHMPMLIVGVLLSGLGYGVMQPIIYDKAATIAPPRSATWALACVMAMNYLAVMACPFLLSLASELLHVKNEAFAFTMNAALVLVCAIAAGWNRSHFVLGLDKRYYVE